MSLTGAATSSSRAKDCYAQIASGAHLLRNRHARDLVIGTALVIVHVVTKVGLTNVLAGRRLTGYDAHDPRLTAALASSGVAYLAKPVHLPMLLEQLARLLEDRASAATR